MRLKQILIELNDLTQKGIIQDYAIGGGYAVMFYDIPQVTYDLDVLVLLQDEKDFSNIYEHYRKKGAKIENVYIFIKDMPVQFFPSYISPLYDNAIKEARPIKLENVKTRLVSAEHLVALLLTSFRKKDILRIENLLDKIDENVLLELIERFEDEKNPLLEKYGIILGGTQSSKKKT